MAVNVVSTLAALPDLYKKANELFKDDGNPKRQILFQITNNTQKTLRLAGSHTGAGVIASSGRDVWRAPFQLASGEIALIPVESAGWSAQCAFAYGFALKGVDAKVSAYAMFLLYAYNKRVGYNYGGLHNVSGDEEFITEQDFKEAIENKGTYPGTQLCEKAQKGSGPSWQVDVSHNPTSTYHFNDEVLVQRTATRETISGQTDVSRLRIDFTFEDSQAELKRIQSLMDSYAYPSID